MASSSSSDHHSLTLPTSNPKPISSSSNSPSPQQPPPSPPLPSSLYPTQPLIPKTLNKESQIHSHGLLYPLAPARVLPKNVRSPADQLVGVVNPAFPGRNPAVLAVHGGLNPFGFAPDQAVHAMRPTLMPQRDASGAVHLVPRQMGGGVQGPPKNASAVHPEVTQFPTIPSATDFNYNDLREKNRDDAVITINDRKVRLLDGSSGSLYALCRSWVRNGLPQEGQPCFGEGVKLLPRPLSAPTDSNELKKREASVDEDEKLSSNAEDSIEQLSERDLLEQHIRRAKRFRTRLREERLQRIDRYKQRLALLLPPPPVDQL